METLIQLDQKIFYLINHVLTAPWVDFFFIQLTDFTKTPAFYVLLPVILIIVFRQFGLKGLTVLFLAVLFSSLADVISSSLIKEFVARPRPEFSSLPFEVILRRPSEGSFSFPSSHAFDAFTLASFIFYFCRSWGVFSLTLAALIAYSRVYVGLHFPGDVFAGAAFGSLLGFVGAAVVTRILITPQKRVLK
ncbi:hypothetical protein AZI86_01280 [Bdellovibrio bacteriovorus]|uniref:Phosphatidic acid phosphatase type 2/haloperoxidase domain-containing protein n=1 Tax=Bdellovibrio bacteriovorus TaxID=959 RepID=A0A150WMY7_BDEBC|nr:phosphatase PAP2 family protein [Bdellovibrio bacteriovorus]KYG65736.1 hypothetical protein AZI86_01280 [Bdellovibrio bacteriovorus]